MRLKEDLPKEILTTKTKLLILEYKERFPNLSSNQISTMFCISEVFVLELFDQEFLIVESKINLI